MRTSILGAATAALLSTTALVGAQTTQEPRTNQPTMMEQGATDRSSDQGAKSDRAAEPKDKAGDRGRTAEPKDKAGNTKRTAEPKDKANDSKRSAEPKAKKEDSKRSAEPRDKAGESKRAAEPKDKADDTKRSAEPRDKSDGSKDTARDRDGSQQRDRAASKDGASDGARVNLPQDQRTQVRERLSSHREARVTNVNFSINIGTSIPRNFRVHVIPADVVAIVPQYRGYRYFIVEERVVIVHPTRYEIVDVIEVDGPRRSGPTTATLTLTPAQRALIVQRVPSERVSRDVNIKLALGAEIDRRVGLFEFPEDVVVEVPTVSNTAT